MITELYQAKSSARFTGDTLIHCQDTGENNPWLGNGYYFWDTLLENAHWWGETHYKGKYSIVKVECVLGLDSCYDLHGNMAQLKQFLSIKDKMVEQGLADENTKVGRILEYLRRLNPDFDKAYKSIRACGLNFRNGFSNYIPFSDREGLPMTPKVQICIPDLSNYKINRRLIFHKTQNVR